MQATDDMKLIWLHHLSIVRIICKLGYMADESEQDSLMINVTNMRATHFL